MHYFSAEGNVALQYFKQHQKTVHKVDLQYPHNYKCITQGVNAAGPSYLPQALKNKSTLQVT
jgi:hypothetical protein